MIVAEEGGWVVDRGLWVGGRQNDFMLRAGVCIAIQMCDKGRSVRGLEGVEGQGVP